MARAPSGRWLWLTIAVLAADRASKSAIERFTPANYRRVLVSGFADLVHSVNPGIAFGMFSEMTSRWVSVFFGATSIAVVLLLLWFLISGRAGGAVSQAGIALIAGGAAGNALDRLLHGGVTDFLELHAGRFVWPAFNVADSAITIGAVLVAWELVFGMKHASAERA